MNNLDHPLCIKCAIFNIVGILILKFKVGFLLFDKFAVYSPGDSRATCMEVSAVMKLSRVSKQLSAVSCVGVL